MTTDERIKKLKEYRNICHEKIDDSKTSPEDFIKAMQGWALFTDVLEELKVPGLYTGKKFPLAQKG